MIPARVTLALMSAALLLPAVAGAQGVRPGSLLIYYGYPTSINATWSVPAAAVEFGRYDYVMWGDGLDAPAHPDHANAVAILVHAATVATHIFGYVDLGVSTQNLAMAEIEARIARWKAMGVEGVLLDDFGYDYGTGRARQNGAVDFAHAQGLTVIANAFRPEDAFGNDSDPAYNPSGTVASLGASDFYLYESHGVRLGEYEDAGPWLDKSGALEAYRQALGFSVLSITTTATDNPAAYEESRFFYAWHAALLSGHAATGWGEFGFSAFGASNGQAPFRVRPALDPGSAFTGPVVHAGPLHIRRTDQGLIELDTTAHTFGFTAGSVGVAAEPTSAVRSLTVAPNPARAAMRVAFTLERAATVRLTMFDATGRRVALLAEGEFEAGRHGRPWAGLDDTGRRVVAGTYFLALDAGSRRSVSRVVVVR